MTSLCLLKQRPSSIFRALLAALICVAVCTAAGDAGARDMEETLKCPVCDYTISYLVRQVAKQHRLCQGAGAADITANESLRLLCDTTTAAVVLDMVMAKVGTACSDDVLESFPAIETLIPSAKDDADLETLEKKRRVEMTESVRPIDRQFHATIQRVCSHELPKKQQTRLAKAVHTVVTNGLAVYPPESDGSDRRDVYKAVLAVQREFCNRACGEAIKRPPQQERPKKAAFNAYGRRIRYHE